MVLLDQMLQKLELFMTLSGYNPRREAGSGRDSLLRTKQAANVRLAWQAVGLASSEWQNCRCPDVENLSMQRLSSLHLALRHPGHRGFQPWHRCGVWACGKQDEANVSRLYTPRGGVGQMFSATCYAPSLSRKTDGAASEWRAAGRPPLLSRWEGSKSGP
jgi:hypothetical protein